MERFQILKPIFSNSLPDRLRKITVSAAELRRTGKETTEQLYHAALQTATHISYAAQDVMLAVMRTGLQAATDMQCFFLTDISLYSCLQYAANLARQAMSLLKK